MKRKLQGLAVLLAGLILANASGSVVYAVSAPVLTETKNLSVSADPFSEPMICTSDYVRLRETPRGKILGKVNSGTMVYTDGKVEGGWYHVSVPDVGVGYIYQSFLVRSSSPSVEAPVGQEDFFSIGTRICCGNQVRVRRTPGGTVIGKLPEGASFEVDGEVVRGWVHVNVPELGIGYIYQEYVQNIYEVDKEDYSRYEGYWITGDGNCTLQLYCFFEQEAYFSWQIRDGGEIQVEAAGVYGTFMDEKTIAFTYVDSLGSEGEGTLTLDGQELHLQTATIKRAPGAKAEAACDVTLQQMDRGEEGFVFPDSDSRRLARAEVERLSADECRIARNEIFARNGRIFQSPDLVEYFESQRWYKGTIAPEDFDADTGKYLNSYEKANLKLILEVEAK